MGIVTLEGIVEQGRIRLLNEIQLPEKTKVYVVVPGLEAESVRHIFSPRLVHPEQATDFKMEIVKDSPDASV